MLLADPLFHMADFWTTTVWLIDYQSSFSLNKALKLLNGEKRRQGICTMGAFLLPCCNIIGKLRIHLERLCV